MKSLCAIILSIFLTTVHVGAQMVMDAYTGEIVAFASIQSVEHPDVGTSTAEDGTFSLAVDIGTEIRVSSIGYKPQNLAYTGPDLIVLLEKQIAEIEEIVITPDESEAARVLNLCVKHRNKNAPMQRDYFQCLLYNKFRVDMLRDSLSEPAKLVRMLEKRITGQTIFFSESAMTYKFESPDRVEEHIIANNVPGFEAAKFNFLPEQLIEFDINRDFLDLLNRHYLLPVSKGSERHYALHLEETNVINGDTTWYIQFWPEKSNYDLLRGHIIIHSDRYAIEEYRLTNNKHDHQKFDIYHHFRKFDGEWFPDKMYSNIVMTDAALNVNVLYDQKTIIDEVKFDKIKIKLADANRMDFAKGSTDNPQKIEQYRLEPLTEADKIAMLNVSTTVENLNVERKMDIIANLAFGRFPIGPLDLEIARFFWSNKTEGYRPGIGVITNDKFSKRFAINAFAGYGLGDELWKYGGGLTYHLNEQKSASIYGLYEKEIYPISSYVTTDVASSIIANFYSDQLDDIKAYTAGIKGRLSNWVYDFSFKKSSNRPRYIYAYRTEQDQLINKFEISEFTLNLNYIRRKYVPFYSYEIELQDYHSTFLDLQLSYAPNNLLNSNTNYFRAAIFAKRPINFKHLGRMELAIHAGALFGDKPISRLHIGNGSNSSGLPYQLPYSFNTMRPFTHFADRYINLFYDHRLIRLYQTRFSSPYIHIAQHSGWGHLDEPENQLIGDHGLLPQDYRQGYHESGLILESILRYEVFSVMQLGMNLGGWYRWGPYASGNMNDDLVFKLGFSITF